MKNMTFKLPLQLNRKNTQMVYEIFKCLYLIHVPLLQFRVKKIKLFSSSIRYIYFHTPKIEKLLQQNWIFDFYLHLMLSLYQWQKSLCCGAEKLVININEQDSPKFAFHHQNLTLLNLKVACKVLRLGKTRRLE